MSPSVTGAPSVCWAGAWEVNGVKDLSVTPSCPQPPGSLLEAGARPSPCNPLNRNQHFNKVPGAQKLQAEQLLLTGGGGTLVNPSQPLLPSPSLRPCCRQGPLCRVPLPSPTGPTIPSSTKTHFGVPDSSEGLSPMAPGPNQARTISSASRTTQSWVTGAPHQVEPQ